MPNNERPAKKQEKKEPNETENETEWIDEEEEIKNATKFLQIVLGSAAMAMETRQCVLNASICLAGRATDQASFSPIGGHCERPTSRAATRLFAHWFLISCFVICNFNDNF